MLTQCKPSKEGPAPNPGGSTSETTKEPNPQPASEPPEKKGPDPLVLEGKENFNSCATCHCPTDPRIEEDKDWVKLNEATTCIEQGRPVPRIRKSIIAYLNDPGTLRPDLVDQDYKPEKGVETGKISVPAVAGSAYLKADRESIKKGSPFMIRLVWKASEAEKMMTVPAGVYTVIGYWLYRTAGKDGKERWMMSVTNVEGCSVLEISPELESYLVLEPTAMGDWEVEKKDDLYALKFTMHDMSGNRMTLSMNGEVTWPSFEILSEDGKALDRCKFNNT
jgi:hypothetical protein